MRHAHLQCLYLLESVSARELKNIAILTIENNMLSQGWFYPFLRISRRVVVM